LKLLTKPKKLQETSNPELWNRVWDRENYEDHKDTFWELVNREPYGIRGTKIQNYIRKYLGDVRGLKTIEVGSGPGIYSFILARLGAEVTLLDYSQKALDLARVRFEPESLSASYLSQDALHLDPSLYGHYDIAMSFGTVEHFRYPERLQIIQAHLDLVKCGGSIVISAPNRAFFPHEVLKAYLQNCNKWHLGFEGAFSRAEFIRIARQLNLGDPEVIGSAFISDFRRYLRIYRETKLAQKVFGRPSKQSMIRDRSSAVDDFLGASLTLLGMKR